MTHPSNNIEAEIDEIFKDCGSYEYGAANSYEFDKGKAKAALKNLVSQATVQAEIAVMEKFGIKKGVKYDVKASDKVIVLTTLQSQSKGGEKDHE